MTEETTPYQKSDINFFAVTNFRSQQRPFGIKRDDRRRHMYLIGKTGMGKSNTLENMIINDIQSGNGVAVIDPHGDTVEKVVNFIPTSRINDVVFFNPSDSDHPIAFNVLESVNPQYKNLIASGLVGVFKKIWADSWGPRLEYILINTILALLESPGSTMLGVTRMLVDKKFRKKIVDRLTDPVVKAFWVNEYANYNERFRSEAISPIQNKVGQFLSSPIIRNIVGQSKSTIDIREIMDTKKILLMNLSKGRIGEENSALLGAMMITRLQIAAMSRVDIPETEREDFYLYVDEFQNFSTDSFADILSEARKYRLNLIIAHQYIEQLGEKVQASVFGNVGSIICFRVGAADAEFLEKEFAPYFTETDLVNLPKYQVYLKLMIDGVSSQPFSANTLPPIAKAENTSDTVIRVSRERYAKKKEEVEDKILRWSGVEEVFRETAEEENFASTDARRVNVRNDGAQKPWKRQESSRPGGQNFIQAKAEKAAAQPQARREYPGSENDNEEEPIPNIAEAKRVNRLISKSHSNSFREPREPKVQRAREPKKENVIISPIVKRQTEEIQSLSDILKPKGQVSGKSAPNRGYLTPANPPSADQTTNHPSKQKKVSINLLDNFS